MSLTFHDGTNALYRSYATQSWDNASLLMLSSANEWDKWLIDDYNKEKKIIEMFGGERVKNCYPFGTGKSKLSDYVTAKETGLIVIKGLHQWKRKSNGYDYQLHLTFGLEGQLWHLNADYSRNSDSISLSSICTAGDRVTGVDHDGFKKVKRR